MELRTPVSLSRWRKRAAERRKTNEQPASALPRIYREAAPVEEAGPEMWSLEHG